jgi:ribonuclease Z
MKRKMKFFGSALIVVFAAMGFYLWGQHADQTGTGLEIVKSAEAAGGAVKSPTGTAPDRYVYFPGTEELGKDEIRLIALGTGMPSARRSQAATCWLVELGNGDKFLFDIGTGANANMAALMIPFDFLNKVFLTHLHTDHWGDLPGLWAGGWTAGRTIPLEIWGPSGAREDMGTKYAVEHFLKAYNWDNMTRQTSRPNRARSMFTNSTIRAKTRSSTKRTV